MNPEIRSDGASLVGLAYFIDKAHPYAQTIYQGRRSLIVFNLSASLLLLFALLLFVKPYYEAGISILPEYGSKPKAGALGDLASLAGVSIGESSVTEIYIDILQSESVMVPVILSKYKTEESSDSLNLIEYFEIPYDSSLPAEVARRKQLLICYQSITTDRLKTRYNKATRIVEMTIQMPEPKLAAAVINRIAENLDVYIRTKRKSYASNQRFYLEKRIVQVRDSLSAAEEKLRDFRDKNRSITQSPQLLLEQSRCMRSVEIFQSVYMTIVQQLELAKIDEIKDSPIVNVKELADNPVLKAGPKRSLIFAGGVFSLIVFSVLWVLFRLGIADTLRKLRTLFHFSQKVT